MSQLDLLKSKRFLPLFITQFCGAFNDNVFKNALAIFLTFHATTITSIKPALLVNLCAGVFILPFFLFSATAGQIADQQEKTVIIRWVKAIELVIMLLGATGFWLHNLPLLLATLFLLGMHSTVFGPVKYSILPQHLHEEELVGGNGLIEGGTFLSILLGTIVGGIVATTGTWVAVAVGGVTIGVGMIGLWSCLSIPLAPPAAPGLRINWNPLTETIRNLKFTAQTRTVFLSVLGVSWFWLFGGTYLTQFPGFVRDVIGGNEHVVTLLLAIFSIGIGAGSMLCERLSGKHVEIGLVPFGAFGLAVFSIELYFASPTVKPFEVIGIVEFLSHWGGIRILADLLLIGLFGGFFIVPLYALIQTRSEKSHQSRIIAGNNIFNAGFMVAGSLLAAGLLHLGLSIPQLFLVTSILHVGVALYIFTLVPEFLMRFIIWWLMKTMYRLSVVGEQKLPTSGAALLVCNHVSFVDALIIAAGCRRPIRFVTHYTVYRLPILNFIFRTGRAIPIASAKENKELMERAFAEVSKALANGELVCIFPEGRITDTGQLYPFKPGVTKILQANPVLVVPLALQGLWGSFFSRKYGKAMSRPWVRGLQSKITLVVGDALTPNAATPENLQKCVAELRGTMP